MKNLILFFVACIFILSAILCFKCGEKVRKVEKTKGDINDLIQDFRGIQKDRRIADLKYAHLLWIGKQIAKLRKKIDIYKLKHVLIALFLMLSSINCAIPLRIIQEQKIVSKEVVFFYSDHPIVKAFAKNGFSREDIMPYLYDYGKEDFDGFWEYMKTKRLKDLADWYLEDLYDRVKIDYNYFYAQKK